MYTKDDKKANCKSPIKKDRAQSTIAAEVENRIFASMPIKTIGIIDINDKKAKDSSILARNINKRHKANIHIFIIIFLSIALNNIISPPILSAYLIYYII